MPHVDFKLRHNLFGGSSASSTLVVVHANYTKYMPLSDYLHIDKILAVINETSFVEGDRNLIHFNSLLGVRRRVLRCTACILVLHL